jgi:hypothetical protein
MPTYAELQVETWWGREIIPDPLRELGARLCTAYGRPITAYGTKGDNLHLSGSHRSQEWIVNSRYCRNRTYTVQSGLTTTQVRHIAGFDFNPGSTSRMIEICTRLDKAVRAGRLEQVLAWYGNDDGDNIVDGYNNVVNQVSTSDASHLWHLHMTLDRKLVDNAAAIRAVGDVLLNQATDGGIEDMFCQKGDKGNAPRALQLQLRRAGFDPGTIDGDYGAATAAAVLAMRKAAGSSATSGDTYDAWGYDQLSGHLLRKHAGKDGTDGEDGEDGRTPTAAEIQAATVDWLDAHKDELRGEPGLTPTKISFTVTATGNVTEAV